jgi:hypothetical protein
VVFDMVDFHKLAIPIIIILIVGGTAGFFLAYGFYPKKNVNVDVRNVCYELLGSSFAEYKYLDAKKRMNILKLQYDAIEPPNALIPIIVSGTNNEITEFTDKYNIDIVEEKQVGDASNENNNIDKYIVKGTISKPYFKQMLNGLTLHDFDSAAKTIQGSIGIQPNQFITLTEGKEISTEANNFMKSGIQQMIEDNRDDIKQAECRSKIQY